MHPQTTEPTTAPAEPDTTDPTAERTFRLTTALTGYRPLVLTCALADLAGAVRRAFDPAGTGTEVEISADGSTATVLNPDGTPGFVLTVESETPAEPDPRRTFYDLVVAGIAAGLPIPSTISIPADNVIASVWLGDDNPAAVDRWAAYLGLPAAVEGNVITGDSRSWRNYKAETWKYPAMPGWCVCAESYVTVPVPPACVFCKDTPAAAGTCCSSHGKRLCHLCYRRTHFVDICAAGCRDCAAEGLSVRLSEAAR
jgi:hypothetical protein